MGDLALRPSLQDCPQYGLVSLWDIMERFYLADFIGLERLHQAVCSALRLDASEQKLTMSEVLLNKLPKSSDREFRQKMLTHVIEDMIQICGKFQLTHSIQSIEPLRDNPPQTDRELAIYYGMMLNELGGSSFFQMPAERARYYRSNALVSNKVKDRFSAVPDEIQAAGTAYACRQSTASVFHSMRAAEAGLLEIAAQLEVPTTDDQMLKNVVDGIQAAARKLDDIPRHPNKKSDSQFYSEVALEAGLMKDAWRNYVSHAKKTYSEPEAIEILNATCRFYEKIAARPVPAKLP